MFDTALEATATTGASGRKRPLADAPTNPAALVSAPQFQRLLNDCARNTLNRYIKDGIVPPPDKLLPGYKPRRMWRRGTIDAWLQQRA